MSMLMFNTTRVDSACVCGGEEKGVIDVTFVTASDLEQWIT